MSQTPSPSDAAAVPAETIAVLMAVVAAHLGEMAKVRAVRLAPPPGEDDSPVHWWAIEGRRQIYASHKIR